MRSYMFEVAEMIGVRVGERFEIDTLEGVFTLYGEGLYSMATQSMRPDVMFDLLTGKLNIKRKPWKPAYTYKYYSIGPGGVLEPGTWLSDFIDLAMYKLGNCYRTAEEAEAHADKWKAFYASDKILEV